MEVLWRHKPRSCTDFVAQITNLRQRGANALAVCPICPVITLLSVDTNVVEIL